MILRRANGSGNAAVRVNAMMQEIASRTVTSAEYVRLSLIHILQLTEMTREANKRFFDSIDEVPTAAFTMGIGTVMAAKKIVMVITGADKAEILNKVFFGPVTPEVPGSILQFHPDVTLICDEAAASKSPL